jgi:hypothetical protein
MEMPPGRVRAGPGGPGAGRGAGGWGPSDAGSGPLGVRNRVEMAAWAWESGLADPGTSVLRPGR